MTVKITLVYTGLKIKNWPFSGHQGQNDFLSQSDLPKARTFVGKSLKPCSSRYLITKQFSGLIQTEQPLSRNQPTGADNTILTYLSFVYLEHFYIFGGSGTRFTALCIGFFFLIFCFFLVMYLRLYKKVSLSHHKMGLKLGYFTYRACSKLVFFDFMK